MCCDDLYFFFSSRRRHTICALVTGVQTCALPILKPVGGDCFEYLSETRPIALVRWTYGSPVEFSRFCVRDNQVYPSHFKYSNDRRSDDNFTLDFDPKKIGRASCRERVCQYV